MRATFPLSEVRDISYRAGEPDGGSPATLPARAVEIPDREARVRLAFGLAPSARLPRVDRHSLQRYRTYLAAALSVPFAAQYFEDVEQLGVVDQQVTVLGLPDLPEAMIDPGKGLLAMGEIGSRPVVLRLADLRVEDDGANQQLIEDYWYWFWNWQA